MQYCLLRGCTVVVAGFQNCTTYAGVIATGVRAYYGMKQLILKPETVTIKATAAAILIQICNFLYTSHLSQCH